MSFASVRRKKQVINHMVRRFFRKIFSRVVLSYIFIFSTLFNSFAPTLLLVTPVFAAESPQTNFTYIDSTHSFDLTVSPVSDNVSYGLFYKTPEKIEAVLGGGKAVGGEYQASIYAGTKSAKDALPADIERGVFKKQVNKNTTSYYFVMDGSKLRIVAEVPTSEIELSNSELSWINDPSTYGDLRTGVTYHAPFSQEVSLTFTSLPENPGSITIKQVSLTTEQMKLSGSISNIAYDITSDMNNGDFEYDLSLPVPEASKGKEVGVKYAEELSEVSSAKQVENTLTKTDSSVSVASLDHFTIFVVSGVNAPSCAGASITPPSGTTACFPTIQAAINVANDGDTINVAAGTYPEYLSINNKSVSLIGAGSASTTIRSTTGGSVITVNNASSPMTIEGFSIDADNSANRSGIYIQNNSSNVLVKNNNLVNFTDKGILISNSDNNTLQDNTLAGSAAGSVAGVYMDNGSEGNEIASNSITLATSGSGLLYDIWLTGSISGDNTVRDNIVNGGSRAFQQDGSVSGTVNFSNNIIGNVTPPTFSGVYLNGGSAVISGNTIKDSVRPIEFWGANNVTITGNTLDGTTYDFINIGSFTGTLSPIKNNTFLNMGAAKFRNQTGNDVDATENDWGVYLYQQIEERVTHDCEQFKSDAGLSGLSCDSADSASLGKVDYSNPLGTQKYIRFVQPAAGPYNQATSVLNLEVEAKYEPYDIKKIKFRFAPPGESCQEQYVSPTFNDLENGVRSGDVYTGTWDISGLTTGDYKVCALMHRDNIVSEGWKVENVAESAVTIDKNTPVMTSYGISDNLLNASENSIVLSGNISDASSPIDSVKYSIWNSAKTVLYANWTEASALDGTYDTETESTNQIIDVSGYPDDTFILSVRGWDKAGNKASGGNFYFTVDRTSPTATISYDTTDWINGTVTATLNPSESVTITNNSTSSSYTFTDNGSFTFTFVDSAGNTGSATATVNNIDKDTPIMSSYGISDILLNASENSIVLSGDISDATSPIDSVKYSIWNSAKTVLYANWTEASAAVGTYDSKSESTSHTIDTSSYPDGDFVLGVRGWDKAGNKASGGDFYFTVDRTNPNSTITSPSDAVSGSTVYLNEWDGSIAGDATDNLSGVSDVKISIQKGSTQYFDGSSFVDSATEILLDATYLAGSWNYNDLTSPAEGSYTISSHAIDNAGNVENTYVLTIIFDKTIPEVSLTVNPATSDASNGWYKTQPEVTLTATDTNIDKIEYQWDSKTGSWSTYFAPFKPSSEGAHVLYYRALDKAGNYSDIGVKNIKWDKTELTEGPQNVSVSPNPTSGDKSTVTWEAASDNTGIDHYEIQWRLGDKSYTDSVGSDVRSHELSNLTEGSWTVIVRAFDGAGNNKEVSVGLTVDRTAPQAPTLALIGTGAGTASLSWNSVDDAKSYIIWYGTSSGSYLYGANVGNVTSYTVQGLGGGTYYFIVRANDSSGNGSSNSNEVSTGAIEGAPGVAAGAPATGFEEQPPTVLGAETTEPAEVALTENDNQEVEPGSEKGSILGVFTNNNFKWWYWLLPLFLLMAHFGFRWWVKRRKRN